MIIILFCLLLLSGAALTFLIYQNIKNNRTMPYYLAADAPQLTVIDKEKNEYSFTRGTLVNIRNKEAKIDDVEYRVFEDDGKLYYVGEDHLETDRRECVKETECVALRDHVLSSAPGDFHIRGWVRKKEGLMISGYHELLPDGTVDYYEIANTGYIPARYVAAQYYETAYDSSVYADVYYGGGGDPQLIDYYPKEDFTPRTPMPEKVNALYINAEAIVDADSFIAIADETAGINAFVVDIKDCYVDTQLAYDSPVGQRYAPSTENIPNTYDSYQENVRKLKDAGYYLIGRITAFKDDSFAIDNPEEALEYDGRLYNYGSVKWPSVYSRLMWEYDVALALEAVEEMGFDEIQFDYIRFPEDVEDVDLKNSYGETRAQGVTNFLHYASEFLHTAGAYVSADVFGETSGDDSTAFSSFVSYYGQFWPAVSNAADAISSMPYPDHFQNYAYGIAEPWSNPGELMYAWGKATYYAQENTYDKARCRTWIMAQSSDVYDVYYGPDFIAEQISGLRSAGVDDGYMTWNAASSLSKYESYIPVLD